MMKIKKKKKHFYYFNEVFMLEEIRIKVKELCKEYCILPQNMNEG